MEKNKIDKIVEICIDWNNRKITAKEAMFKIYDINKEYILSEVNPKREVIGFKKCKFCQKNLPMNRISYCNKDCMNKDGGKK